MPLVAGVDTSTQSCKIVVRDASTGELVRSGSAKHPDGTEIDPQHWWTAFQQAAQDAGGLDDVAADAVGSVLVASLTITKLRWLRDAEPENAAKVAAVALPHDWLSWRIAGYGPAGESPLGPQ